MAPGERMITIPGFGDHVRADWPITINGMRMMKYQAQCETGLDGNLRIAGWPPRSPVAGACQAATASSESQTVMLPRLINAESYSGQFVTRYLAFGIL
jgi:hypothetical protein